MTFDPTKPIDMRLPCPECGVLHIDEGDFETKVHHTHACQFCGMVWRPAVVPTRGVQFLPGFLNEKDADKGPINVPEKRVGYLTIFRTADGVEHGTFGHCEKAQDYFQNTVACIRVEYEEGQMDE